MFPSDCVVWVARHVAGERAGTTATAGGNESTIVRNPRRSQYFDSRQRRIVLKAHALTRTCAYACI